MMKKSNLTEPQLKRIYDFINLVYAQKSINIGIKTTVTHSNNLKDDLNTIPTVKVKVKKISLQEEETTINVAQIDKKGKVFRQNGKELRIGGWYYYIEVNEYFTWDEGDEDLFFANEYGLPNNPIRIEEPPKGHPAWDE
jgi:hypothetical protein